jgi:hypothetical protein
MDARLQRLWERGMAHFRVGNFVAAQGAFDAMLALDPGSVPALYRLSLLQARQGRFRGLPALAALS